MKRVIMLLGHRLFGEGVETLLRREPGLEIVGRETDAAHVIDRIRELRPDVVVVDSTDPDGDFSPLVRRILKEGVVTDVIGLNLENNTMCVYREERRVFEEVKDLVEAVERHAAA